MGTEQVSASRRFEVFNDLRPLPILAVCWRVAVECGRLARAGGRKKFAEIQAGLKSCFAPSPNLQLVGFFQNCASDLKV